MNPDRTLLNRIGNMVESKLYRMNLECKVPLYWHDDGSEVILDVIAYVGASRLHHADEILHNIT